MKKHLLKSDSTRTMLWAFCLFLLCGTLSCLSGEDSSSGSGEGLAPTPDPNGTRIKFDPLAQPMPEIPFPNDLATVMDASSATGRRLNIRMAAPTKLEEDVRSNINTLDGFGTFSPITVSFEKPLDLRTVNADNVLILNIDPASPRFGQSIPIDFPPHDWPPDSATDHPDWTAYPLIIEGTDCSDQHPCQGSESHRMDFGYFHFDYHWKVNNLMMEGNEEDDNCNGILDPGEDMDYDGVLDHPNVAFPECYNKACFPVGEAQDKAVSPHPDRCPARLKWVEADMDTESVTLDNQLVTNFEFETNTLILRPLISLEERTQYAVVLGRGLRDIQGNPIRSPFTYINHAMQTEPLRVLKSLLPSNGKSLSDVAFAWSFTTQTISQGLEVIRDGLKGKGSMAYLVDRFPAELEGILDHEICLLGECDEEKGIHNTHIMKPEQLEALFTIVLSAMTFSWIDISDLVFIVSDLLDSTLKYVDYFVVGSFYAPMFLDGPDSHFDIDYGTGRARVKEDLIPFWISVPKRKTENHPSWYPDAPFPVAFYGHGYSGSKIEALGFGNHLARFGFATFAMDETGHGPAGELEDVVSVLDEIVQDAEGNEMSLDEILDQVAAICPLVKMWILKQLANLIIQYHPEWDDSMDLVNYCGEWMNEDPEAKKCRAAGECPAKCMVVEFSKTPLYEGAFLSGRAVDLTGDGVRDSGVDFWTARSFHTRDIVRQAVVDYIHTIRVLRSFDGERRWKFDVNGDGEPELAGDFNGDGVVDFGGPCVPDYSHCKSEDADCVPVLKDCDPDDPDDTNRQNYSGMGQSMGAFIMSILQVVEPGMTAIAPVSGGAGLMDIGMRTSNEGVREAVYLEVLGPILIGGTKRDTCRQWTYYKVCEEEEFQGIEEDDWVLSFDALDGNLEKIWPISAMDPLKEGDLVRVRNLSNGEEKTRGVASFGTDEGRKMLGFRVNIPADNGDNLLIQVLDGDTGGLIWQTTTTSIGKGYGYQRNSPDLRRMMGLSQMILDPADPVNYAPHYFWDPLPGMKPKSTLINHTLGDMKVPVGTGLTMARAARLLDYENPVSAYAGDTANEMLLKHWVAEAIPRIHRFSAEKGYTCGDEQQVRPCGDYFDADNVGEGLDDDCDRDENATYPGGRCTDYRLDAPHLPDDEAYEDAGVEGSYDTLYFRQTFATPGLAHRNNGSGEYSGFRLPNIMVYDNALKAEDRHGIFLSAPTKPFNLDLYMINLIGRYFQTRGGELLGAHEEDNATCLEDRKVMGPDGEPVVANECSFWTE